MCPGGYHCATASELPVACPDGEYSADGASTCLTCPAGSYCPAPLRDEGSKAPCPTGQYSLGGRSSCLDCPKGFYCPDSSQAPEACPEGWYADVGNMTSCDRLVQRGRSQKQFVGAELNGKHHNCFSPQGRSPEFYFESTFHRIHLVVSPKPQTMHLVCCRHVRLTKCWEFMSAKLIVVQTVATGL